MSNHYEEPLKAIDGRARTVRELLVTAVGRFRRARNDARILMRTCARRNPTAFYQSCGVRCADRRWGGVATRGRSAQRTLREPGRADARQGDPPLRRLSRCRNILANARTAGLSRGCRPMAERLSRSALRGLARFRLEVP
jgi:hypothetical protein